MRRQLVTWTLCLIGIWLLANPAVAQYPDCSWRCTANDVYVPRIYLDAPETCVGEDPLSAGLYVVFENGTRTDRYAVRFLADLYIDGDYERSFDECVADTMAPGQSEVLLAVVQWSCGQTVEIRDIIVSWSASPETCGEIPSCSARTAKCWSQASVLVAGAPLSATFEASTPVCDGEAVLLTTVVRGGLPPYTYAWIFGDGTTSASANPSHTYPGPGTYTVDLTVFDDRGAAAHASEVVDVEANPTADAWNDGPFCPGEPIRLFAAGGTAYEWTGPNGFTSSEQNPTIWEGSGTDAGVYTVLVSNDAGCIDRASTQVAIDAAIPTLTIPADTKVECGSSIDPAVTGQATAFDEDDPNVIVKYVDDDLLDCGETGTITRTWTATDACGNVAAGLQTIEVIDTTPPILTVSSVQFECDGAGNVSDIDAWLASALATDVCGSATVTNDFAGLTAVCSGTGSAEVLFTATDDCGNTVQRTASVIIIDTTPPRVGADTAATDEGTAAWIDVLANDGGACDPSPSLVEVGAPTFGVAEIDTGGVRYTPPEDFDGTDTFSYTIEDCSGNRASSLVEVTVRPVNDPPIANDEAVTAHEDTPVSLTVTATDPEGDALTYSILTGPSNGTIREFNPATGALIYTPMEDYSGPDSFTFKACDPGGLCDTSTVTITIEPVDDPPTADAQERSTPEETSLSITVTGEDVDRDPLSYGIVDGPGHGAIDSFDPITGTLIYTPEVDYTGVDRFVFEVCDSHPDHGCAQATVTITVTPVNDPPLAQDQARVTSEETPTGFFRLAITDPDNTLAELSCDCLSPPQHGTVERGPDHTANYTPNADFSGTDTFAYEVCDPDGLCDTATVTVIVTATNDNPAVSAENQTTFEDTPIEFPVVHVDPDGDELSCSASDPAHGTVFPTSGTVRPPYPATGSLTYRPDPDYTGVDQIVITCDDGQGGTDSVTIEITILPVNDPPVASDSEATTQEETPLSLTLTASDPDGDALTYSILAGPSNGTIREFDPATGGFLYTPDTDYNGPDSFAFRACDSGGLCDEGRMTIAVYGVDDPPTAEPQALVTPEEVPVRILLTGRDVDGDSLTYGIVSGPSHATISGFDPLTGELLYTPDADFSGTDGFVFEVCDTHAEHGCAQATVTILVTPVNDPPLAQDQTRTTIEDTETGFFALLISDPDNTLAEVSCDCLSPPQHGTIERGPNHTVNYTPDPDFSGTDTFRYLVCDPDGSCDTATVTVTVAPMPDPPVARDDSASVAEDGSVTIDVTRNDADPDGDLDRTSVLVTSGPASGTTSVDPATGAIRYEPGGDFNGEDLFTYEICDNAGACDVATVRVRVVPVDDPPVARDDAANVLEDESVLIDVAANDTDPDGNLDPTSVSVISPPANGSVTVDPTTGAIRYEPNPGYVGPDVFTYEICDRDGVCDTATVTIDVQPVDDPPIAKDDTKSTEEGTPVVVDVTANDTDPDGNLDRASVEIVSPPSNGAVHVDRSTGHVTYRPNEQFVGTDAFRYRVCDTDGLCDTATVTVNVGPSNDAPAAADDAGDVPENGLTVIDVLANDEDPNGNIDPTSVIVVSPPSHGTYSVDSATGSITYAPDAGYEGEDSFIYQVCDTDGECDTAIVTVAILPIAESPVARDDRATVAEDGSVAIDVLANDRDPDGDLNPGSVMVIAGPGRGAVVVDPVTGSVIYEPEPNFAGTDEFTYEICDLEGACDTASVRIDVTPVDDSPIAADDTASVVEDGAVQIDVAANDKDPDGDLEGASVSIVDPPSNGTAFVDPATGAVTYAPDANFNGDDVFTYEICDRGGLCATASVSISVAPQNDPPTAVCLEATITDGVLTPIQLLGRDPDGDTLTYRITSVPPRGVLIQPDSEGIFTYSSQGEGPFSGPISLVFEVCDEEGACDECVVQLLVVRTAGGGGITGCEQRIVISEVAWSGTDADPNHEWIELRNMEDVPVDLEGWTLRWRRKVSAAGERNLWKAIPLSGVIGPAQADLGLAFTPNDSRPGTWWVSWDAEWRDDLFLAERAPGEAVLHIPADLVYEDGLLLGRVADLDDRGEVIQLIDPFGCVVDTANAEDPGRAQWIAGSLWPTGTMERTDSSAPDLDENWHTNLGLVRAEMDAWGQLIRGTPKYENSPILADAVSSHGIEPTSHPMGEPILLRLDPLPEWPADDRLWRIVVTRPPNDQILDAEWSIGNAQDGALVAELDASRLPLDEEFHVWVRTPSGDLLFAPFLLDPY